MLKKRRSGAFKQIWLLCLKTADSPSFNLIIDFLQLHLVAGFLVVISCFLGLILFDPAYVRAYLFYITFTH